MKKKEKTYKEHLHEARQQKQELPLHKMNDVSRRQFIQGVGYFLTALSVPSLVRVETLSKISKKIFGNSLAFAAVGEFETKPIVIKLNFRSGYAYSQWLIGCYNDNVTTTPDRNVPWSFNNVVSVPTATGIPTIIPPSSAGLLNSYANGIQNFLTIAGPGGHFPEFKGSHYPTKGELTTWRAATEINSGSNTTLTSPFAFGDISLVALRDVPASLQDYAPTVYTNIQNVYSQFTAPQFLTNQGTNISNSIQENLFAVMANKFSADIEKSLYKKDADTLRSANTQSFQILATNFADALNPNHPDNTATMAALTAGLPAQIRLDCPVSLPQAMFVGIQAANLGITPRIFDLIIDTQDWHETVTPPSNSYTTDPRYQSARYLAQLIRNVFTLLNDGSTWQNAITSTNEVANVLCLSEFTRSVGYAPAPYDPDNPDNYTNGTLIISSDNAQNVFKAGSYGGYATSYYPLQVYNPGTGMHASQYSIPNYLYGLTHNAQLLGVDLADFGITDSETTIGLPYLFV